MNLPWRRGTTPLKNKKNRPLFPRPPDKGEGRKWPGPLKKASSYFSIVYSTASYVEMRNSSIVRSMSSGTKICPVHVSKMRTRTSVFFLERMDTAGESHTTYLDPVGESSHGMRLAGPGQDFQGTTFADPQTLSAWVLFVLHKLSTF